MIATGAIAQEDFPTDPTLPDDVVIVPMYEVTSPANSLDGGATTNGIVNGNCGSTYLYVGDVSDWTGGKANFWFGASSAIGYGNILSVSWGVSWVNNDTGAQGNDGGVAFPNSVNWSHDFTESTGYGLVEATLSGSAQVVKASGVTTCVFGNPSDSYEIDP